MPSAHGMPMQLPSSYRSVCAAGIPQVRHSCQGERQAFVDKSWERRLEAHLAPLTCPGHEHEVAYLTSSKV